MHSVIVKDNDVYKLYIKGADSSIQQIASKHFEHPFVGKTVKALDDLSGTGLRTLMFGCRVLSKEQYDTIERLYQEALSSSDKKIRMERLIGLVEDNIAYLGCTAIRDHLQDKVPEVITKFSEAGIKVWMITGDKLQTAESIAHATGIFQTGMETFKFPRCRKDNFQKQVLRFKLKIQKAVTKGAKKIGIILDMTAASRFVSPRLCLCEQGKHRRLRPRRVDKIFRDPAA